jgi:hypothetical protein
MDINTVQFTEDGNYVINKPSDPEVAGQFTVPRDIGNRHYKMVQKWINNGGVVTEWVDPTTPYQHWHNEISELDKDMSRSMEDMLDGMPDKSGVAQITLDRLQAKKDKRSEKP